MSLLFLFLVSSIPLLFLFYFLSKIFKNTKKSRRNPPGPPGLPFIGNLHQINNSSIHTSLWQLSKSYGPIISLRLGFIPTIAISSANLAKEVMKTQDINFCSRPSLLGQRKLSYDGLDVAFSPHNENWRDMRKIFVLHLFSPKRIQSYRHIREDEVSNAMEKVRNLSLLSKPVKLGKLIKSVTSTIMLRVAFGKRYQDGDERKKALRLLDELQATMADIYVSDIWPGLPFIGLVDRFIGKMDRLEKCFQDFDSFYQEFIDEHLMSLQNSKSCEEDEDVLDILLRLMKHDTSGRAQNQIKAMLMNVFVAGTDTSAATVVWAMTLLMKNPKAMKKAQEEVRNVDGNKGKIDEDHLPKLAYLKAVVKETLRLYPPTPLLLPRETKKDVSVQGYTIKRKSTVYLNALAIGRDPESWDSPEEFLPERFLGSDIDFKGNHFELIPFGAGRRICPGMLKGVVMVELLLANLLYLFDWGLPYGMEKEDLDFEVNPGITMHKKNELCLLAHMYL
uniref:cytochrome P450 71A1-like n=1 Tax=Erigeron canadensis TaxID=72917 RepID=UPI001CB914C3|nr:cytochrome P450 71A1-like [Erigeron canadensis]